MATFIIILVALIVAYWILNLIMHRVPEVEAGPTMGLTSTGSQRVHGNVPSSYRKIESDGSVSIHRNFVVKGKCMEPRGIKEGDVVDIMVFDKSKRAELGKLLEKDQIVLIYLNDRRFRGYKLRIVNDVRDNDALTYYYKDGEIQDSSCPHAFKDIIGILRK